MTHPTPLTRRAVLAGFGAVTTALALTACKDQKKAAIREATGEPAPDLVATRTDGSVVRLEELRGRVVLVNFWLAECGPCLAEMPDFEAFYQDYRDRGVEILAINMGQPQNVVTNVARRLGVSFPVLADPLKITTSRYNVLAAPTSFVIDAEGRLVERVNGPMNHDDLTEKVARRL